MITARVTGEVVAHTRHPALDGRTLLLIVPDTGGDEVIAVDTVSAGIGDHVLVNDEGGGASGVLGLDRGPVRTVVVGIVDEVDA